MIKKDIYSTYIEDGTDKWYFVGTEENPDQIVCTKKVLNTGRSEYGYINHLTPPYKTKELCLEDNSILDNPCVVCRGVVKTTYSNRERLIERNMCFSCDLWTQRVDQY